MSKKLKTVWQCSTKQKISVKIKKIRKRNHIGILGFKSKITIIKSSLGGELKRRLKQVEEKKSANLKAGQFRLSRLMKRKKNELTLKDLWDTVKHANMCIRGVSEERKKGEARIFQKIMSPKFLKFNEKHEATHPKKSNTFLVWNLRDPHLDTSETNCQKPNAKRESWKK